MLKINKRFLIALLTFTLPFGCVACSDSGSASYDQISGAEAKALMDSESGYVIIDARTQEEYDQGHIPGAILIPEYEIADRAEKELPDKDQLILVYCRSGRRSKIAAEELVKLGYTNVKEFGGIIDWEYRTRLEQPQFHLLSDPLILFHSQARHLSWIGALIQIPDGILLQVL